MNLHYPAPVHNPPTPGRQVCYNFMPVVDWTRTNLDFDWGDGSRALRFDRLNFAAFELHILKRPGAEAMYTPEQLAQAKGRFDELSQNERNVITTNVVAGMPGRMTSDYGGGLEAFQAAIDKCVRSVGGGRACSFLRLIPGVGGWIVGV